MAAANSSDDDDDDVSTMGIDLDQPLAVLRQCVQFKRGDTVVSDDQLSLLRAAAAVLQQHSELEAAVIGVREEAEVPELEMARAQSVRATLQSLGASSAAARVRCLAGGAGPRGNRRADLRVLQQLRLPAPLEFDHRSHDLSRACRSSIRGMARRLSGTTLRICLQGSHDESEEPDLALARAEAVRDRLLQRGLDSSRIQCTGAVSCDRSVDVRVLEFPCNAFVSQFSTCPT